MRFSSFYLSALLFILFNSNLFSQTDVLYQSSTINALLGGVYDGNLTIGQLKQEGDFGVGTFNTLDGEMVVLNGEVFQVKSDGKAYLAEDSEKTPFACVTFFHADTTVELNQQITLDELEAYIDKLIPTKNIFYAVKVEGTFSYIKTRSVPKQKKPYQMLAEITKHQPVFEFQNVYGTVAGFRSPSYVNGVNVPGYHLHFLNKMKNAGGHLLSCTIKSAKIQLDYKKNFFLSLPETNDFYKVELEKDKSAEVQKVEK